MYNIVHGNLMKLLTEQPQQNPKSLWWKFDRFAYHRLKKTLREMPRLLWSILQKPTVQDNLSKLMICDLRSINKNISYTQWEPVFQAPVTGHWGSYFIIRNWVSCSSISSIASIQYFRYIHFFHPPLSLKNFTKNFHN